MTLVIELGERARAEPTCVAPCGKTFLILVGFAPTLIPLRGHLIAAITARGGRVVAIAPDISDDIASDLRARGAHPISLPVPRTSLNPYRDLVFLRSLTSIFRRERPDVLIAYAAKPIVWGALAASRSGVGRTIAIITGLGYAFTQGQELPRWVARTALVWLYRFALARCHRVIFLNSDDLEHFTSLGLVDPGRAAVIKGEGVDLTDFSAVPVPSTPSFLMLARLIGDKGVREYCNAALQLKLRYPHVAFRLAGMEETSRDAIRPEELQGWIEAGIDYLGDLRDVRPALAESSVYVLPSYREGVPRSILEAMSIGRAVVTTDVPGCRETVIDQVNGFLIPPRDVESLVSTMARFIEDPSLSARMGRQSRRVAEENFDVRKINSEILRIVASDRD